MSRKRIKCGSRSIAIGDPNWLTGLATIYVNDIGTGVGFTMDLAATRKVILALQALEVKQERIEAERAAEKVFRQLGRGKE
jgi:hypothetical protein